MKANSIAAALALFSALAATPGAAAPRSTEMTVAGPATPLAGTLLLADDPQAPVILIVPGSGPTDRDGNNPLGVTAASYRLLAEALAARGISSARIDKRGMFGSKAEGSDPNRASIDDYAADVGAWATALKAKTGQDCIWVAGHSEGGLVALTAANNPDVCGIVLIAAAGRKLDTVIREQIAANPANAPIADQANAALDALAKGEKVDVSAMHPALAQGLFNPAVQDFLIDVIRRDPAELIAKVDKPVLIVLGLADLQVARADADRLKTAQPKAQLTTIDRMSHTLKQVTGEGRAANMATYTDASLPVDATLVEAIAAFIRSPH